MKNFVYHYPQAIELDEGETIEISQEDLKDERLFSVIIDPSLIDDFAGFLQEQGFESAEPSWDQGEKYGLSKLIFQPWEMHIRIFKNGEIFAHVEIDRDYFEHLDQTYTWPLFYELLKLVDKFTRSYEILFTRTKQKIRNIATDIKLTLSPPKAVTEWMPVVAFVGGIAVGATVTAILIKMATSHKKEKKED